MADAGTEPAGAENLNHHRREGGNWTVTGASSCTGATTVEAGTLTVNGDLVLILGSTYPDATAGNGGSDLIAVSDSALPAGATSPPAHSARR